MSDFRGGGCQSGRSFGIQDPRPRCLPGVFCIEGICDFSTNLSGNLPAGSDDRDGRVVDRLGTGVVDSLVARLEGHFQTPVSGTLT